jgi:hypothetical protein
VKSTDPPPVNESKSRNVIVGEVEATVNIEPKGIVDVPIPTSPLFFMYSPRFAVELATKLASNPEVVVPVFLTLRSPLVELRAFELELKSINVPDVRLFPVKAKAVELVAVYAPAVATTLPFQYRFPFTLYSALVEVDTSEVEVAVYMTSTLARFCPPEVL